jgi:hypothetical protein
MNTCLIYNLSLHNFSSILVLSRWKNWRNWLAKPILGACPTLVIWGLETSIASLRHQVETFGVKYLQS